MPNAWATCGTVRVPGSASSWMSPGRESSPTRTRTRCSAVVLRPDDVPEGMVCWEIPATRYAVFACTLSTIGQAFNDAYQTWLPQSGYERACGPEFEFYDKDYNPADENSTMYVYIPIQ